jgi:hypothetical protein
MQGLSCKNAKTEQDLLLPSQLMQIWPETFRLEKFRSEMCRSREMFRSENVPV